MAEPLFATLQFVHITSAALVLGYLAFAPFFRWGMARTSDLGVVRHTVGLMRRALLWLAFPAFGVLFVSGIAMSFRDTSQGLYDLEVTWIRGSILMTAVLGVLLYGLLGPLRKMQPLLDAGEPEGAATDKLWSEWRFSLVMAAVLALATTWLMIYNTWYFE